MINLSINKFTIKLQKILPKMKENIAKPNEKLNNKSSSTLTSKNLLIT